MTLAPFLWGALTAASMTIALLFLRSWRLSHDRLFLYFAVAFAAFALNWIGIAIVQGRPEASYEVYLPRLLGFVLIIAGVVDKNRRSP